MGLISFHTCPYVFVFYCPLLPSLSSPLTSFLFPSTSVSAFMSFLCLFSLLFCDPVSFIKADYGNMGEGSFTRAQVPFQWLHH